MYYRHFSAGRCRSCSLIEQSYAEQLTANDAHCRGLLAVHADVAWLPPLASAEAGYRNKAKMVVSGNHKSGTNHSLEICCRQYPNVSPSVIHLATSPGCLVGPKPVAWRVKSATIQWDEMGGCYEGTEK